MNSAIRLEIRGAFPHQQAFLDCPKRYVVACSGTKAGKSWSGAMYAVRQLAARPGVRGTWVAPVFGQAVNIGLENVRSLLPREHVTVRMSGTPRLELANGSVLEFKSADQPDNLFGHVADFAVIDEAGRCGEEAWNAVRSTLTATGGPVRMLSNPTGRTGWFFRLYLRGLDANDPDVASFKWRTADNPLIPAAEIDDARRNMSERSFRSLYEGEFLDVGGSVFRNVQKAATGVLQPGVKGRRYVGGLDLARTVDWTVATILDEEAHEVVGWERWHGCSWEMTAERVLGMTKAYPGIRWNVDSTGVGDPVLELIERSGAQVQGMKFSATLKAQLVENLSMLIEQGEVVFPPLDILIGELEAFEASTGPTGTVKYGAPSGVHDDAVISLGLACWGLQPRNLAPVEWRIPRVSGGGVFECRSLIGEGWFQ